MTGWAIDAALASALLMALVLLLRAPVRRLFGPTVAYALWALPALRLALPPMPEQWRDDSATPISRAGELVIQLVATPVTVEEPATATIGLLLWLVGGSVLLAWHLLRYFAFRARILRGHEDLARIGRVRVISSEGAPGPLAFGALRPYIAMPADLDRRYDPDERALALEHELGHHARGDLIANWVALIVLAVHWWNPLAWIAHRAFRADQELANDARVLGRNGPAAAHAYARAILKAAGGPSPAVACHLHTVADLKGRIGMLKSGPVSPRRLVTGVAGVALLATATLTLTASGTRAVAAVKERVGDTIGVDLEAAELDLAALHMPVPPAPPLPAIAPVPPMPPLPAIAPVPPMPSLPQSAPAMPLVSRMPPAPPLPTVTPIPPVPPMPPVPPVPSIGAERHLAIVRTRDGRAERRVIRMHDGHLSSLSSMPEIREARCGGGDRPTVRHERRSGRRVTIICSDRIERAAEAASEAAQAAAEAAVEAPVDAREIERDALRGALEGLRGARASIAGNRHLTGKQRRRALAGLEQGLREIQGDLDRVR